MPVRAYRRGNLFTLKVKLNLAELSILGAAGVEDAELTVRVRTRRPLTEGEARALKAFAVSLLTFPTSGLMRRLCRLA